MSQFGSILIHKEALHELLKKRWIQRKRAAQELLTKYGGNLPHGVVLQVGSLKISMSVEDIIRHTGQRFVEEMIASPASNGIVTISIPESTMPAARLAFNLMEFKVQPCVGENELLDLMVTLHCCNAFDIWDAILASLGQVYKHQFVSIIQNWTRRMQAKPLSAICFPDGQVQGTIISSVAQSILSAFQLVQVRIIPSHPSCN